MADCRGAPWGAFQKKDRPEMAVRVHQEVRLGALWYSIRLLAKYGLLLYTLYIQETYGPPLPSKKPSERERYDLRWLFEYEFHVSMLRFPRDGTETSDNSALSARVLHCAHGSLTHSILFGTGESASPLAMPRPTLHCQSYLVCLCARSLTVIFCPLAVRDWNLLPTTGHWQ